MNQVLVNIFSNAIKYAPDSKKILLSAERLGDEVRINVQDWGKGIAPADLDRIFNQFYRIAEDKNKAPGLGLGLYLCKEFIEAHHGKIWAESKEGNGTIIHITLPIGIILNK